MMNKSNEYISWGIFRKAVLGQLNSKDQILFDNWLNSNEEHRKYFAKAQAFYRNQNYVKEFDYDPSFQQFKSIINQKRLLLTRRLQVAAAAVIMLIFIGSLIKLIIGEKMEDYKPLSVAEKVFPASGKARLTLSNGLEVFLDSQSDTTIKVGDQSIMKSPGVVDYLSFSGNPQIKNEYNTLHMPLGNCYKLVLSDSSVVWLNAESSITYPLYFEGNNRTVLLEGEAYFEITSKFNNTFIVEVGGSQVTVLGTKFNVNSYDSGGEVITTVVQGSVMVESINGKSVALSPGEQSISRSNGEIDVALADVDQVIDWVSGFFNFEDQKLEYIMEKLSRWYNINVSYETEEIMNFKFTGYLMRYTDVNYLLELFELTQTVEFYINDNNILVRQMK